MADAKLIAAGLLVGTLLWVSTKTKDTVLGYENQEGGPNYTLGNLTQAQVMKWSSAALLDQGFLAFSADGSGTHLTPKFYALPVV